MLNNLIYKISKNPISKTKGDIIKKWFLSKEEDYIRNILYSINDKEYIFEINKSFDKKISLNVDMNDFKDFIKNSKFIIKERILYDETENLSIYIDNYIDNLDESYLLVEQNKNNVDSFNEIINWEIPKKLNNLIEYEIEDTYYEEKLSLKNFIKKKDIYKLKKIIDDVLREDLIEEATEIINKMDDFRSTEIVNYYENENYNVICLHLDYIKSELIKQGKIERKKNDQLGLNLNNLM